LHLPVLVTYEVLPNFSLTLGPELQYVLKRGDVDLDYEFTKRLLFGGDFGIAYEFTHNFHIQARYIYTFTKGWNMNPTAYHRINNVQIGLAYFFDK